VESVREAQRGTLLYAEIHAAAPQLETLGRRVEEAAAIRLPDDDAVENDVHLVGGTLLPHRAVSRSPGLGIEHTRQSGRDETRELRLPRQPPGERERERQRDARAGGKRLEAVGDVGRGLPHDALAAVGAVKLRHLGEEQLQVVRQLGHRADGGARRAHGVTLLDGHGRWQILDQVGVGPRHAIEELPGVGRERLDVAPLTLGVERVEHERRLPAPGHTRHDGQRVVRKVDVDSTQVVLPHAAQAYRVRIGGGPLLRWLSGHGRGVGERGPSARPHRGRSKEPIVPMSHPPPSQNQPSRPAV